MGKSHDLATLKDDGGTFKSSLVIDTGTSGTPSIDFKHANSSADQFRLQAGTPAVTNGGFSIYDIDASQTRLNIDASGRVTMPYQPTFRGALNGHVNPNTTVASPGTTISSMHVYENIGNCWNNTTGVFTCPVAGKYQVSIFYIKYPVSGAQHTDLYKNGSIVTNARWRGEETASYNQVGGTVVINCSANDTLQWKEFGSAGIHSGNGTWSITFIG